MKWFKHMTDAHDGNDLTKVRVRYGADGYAVYWYCLELIAGDLGATDKITFELRHDAEVIGHNLKIDTARVEEMMRFMVGLGLFERSNDIITCIKLAKYLDKKSTRNTTIHNIIDAASSMSGTITDKSGLSGLDRDTDLDTDTDTDTDIKTSKFFFDLIKTLNPKHREPNFNVWANDIRLIRERDGRTDNEIRALFEWANLHHFWKTNILSPNTLRKQWDKLVIQRDNAGGANGTHQPDTRSRAKRVSDTLDDIAHRDAAEHGIPEDVG